MNIKSNIKALDADRELWYADHEGGEPTLLNTDDLKSLVTLIEQQSSVIEEAEAKLKVIQWQLSGVEDIPFPHKTAVAARVTATDALARIQQIKNGGAVDS